MPIIVIVIALAAGTYVGAKLGLRRLGPNGQEMLVTFLPPHLGGAVLLQTPGRKHVVIDPGPRRTADALVRHLAGSGVRELAVLVTNPVEERAGAVEALLASFAVKRVMYGESPGAFSDWPEILTNISARGIPELVLSAGDGVALSRSVRLEVLSPPKGLIEGVGRDSDENSLVVGIVFGETRFLLMSDCGTRTEGLLIQSGACVESDVFVVPRHGRAGATSLEFLSAVRPRYCVVTCAGSARPAGSVLSKIAPENTGATLYRTDKDGAVRFCCEGGLIRPEMVEK